MLYSPINYQGNKSRIVDHLLAVLPQNVTSIHEIFCGSAVFSFASNVHNLFLNDINTHITDVVRYFQNNEADDIIDQADAIIAQYGLTNTFYEGKEPYPEKKHEGLSRYNKEAFNRLRNDYNTDKDIAKLFVLLIYGFNHYLRFNAKDEFNVPVGKVDFVKTLRDKTREYCQATKNREITITNYDFRRDELYRDVETSAIYYFDPPYLITQAPYNLFWTEKEEIDLLHIIDALNDSGYRFILSNVVESNGKHNDLLDRWMQQYNVKHIYRQYLNANYRKKNLGHADEVIITNF